MRTFLLCIAAVFTPLRATAENNLVISSSTMSSGSEYRPRSVCWRDQNSNRSSSILPWQSLSSSSRVRPPKSVFHVPLYSILRWSVPSHILVLQEQISEYIQQVTNNGTPSSHHFLWGMSGIHGGTLKRGPNHHPIQRSQRFRGWVDPPAVGRPPGRQHQGRRYHPICRAWWGECIHLVVYGHVTQRWFPRS